MSEETELIDFFIEHPLHEYNIEQLEEFLGKKAEGTIETLVENGSLLKTNKGNFHYPTYQLNRTPVVTRLLGRMSTAIADSVESKGG